MKLYEILNEKYLGRKFRLIKNGIESEWDRQVEINSDGKYGYVMENGVWNLSEGNLLENIKLIETDEDRYEKFIKNDLIVEKYAKNLSGNCVLIASNYDNLKSFKEEEDVLFVELSNDNNHAWITLSFDEFDCIIDYVEELRKFKINK